MEINGKKGGETKTKEWGGGEEVGGGGGVGPFRICNDNECHW